MYVCIAFSIHTTLPSLPHQSMHTIHPSTEELDTSKNAGVKSIELK